MPIPYTTYGCQYKCGWNHSKDIKRIEKHEQICWKNPDNKACLTCQHGKIQHDSCPHPEMPGCPDEYWEWRECNIDVDMEFDGLKPKIKCENWEGL